MRRVDTIRMIVAAGALLAVAGCDPNGERVGPRGGMIVSDDGRFSLEIPEGALEHWVPISIAQVDCEQRNAVGPCYSALPRGTVFLFPAMVVYELGGVELAGVDPHTLGVVSKRHEAWNVLSDRDVDMEDEIVSASAMYLSSFAVVPIEATNGPRRSPE